MFFLIEGENGLVFHGGNDSLNYSNLTINQKGEVVKVMSNFNLGSKSNDELKKLDKKKLIEMFGNPKKHIICDCFCYALIYSKLKKGPYRGKRPVISLRKILIKENYVVGKIEREGNPFIPYLGACNTIKYNMP